jgi:general secretion pathway protein A
LPETASGDQQDQRNGGTTGKNVKQPVEKLHDDKSKPSEMKDQARQSAAQQPAARAAIPEPAENSVHTQEPKAVLPEMELPQKTINVRFENDSSEFFFTDFERVDDFVTAVKKHPEAVIIISGHSDSLGSEGYNYRLSLFRANMVKSFFLGKGIPSYQLKVRAFGGKDPLMPNDTEEGRRMNRRVEIDVVQ